MVLHYLPDRSATSARGPVSGLSEADPSPRVGFVVGKAVGNSVVRHQVTRRLRAVVLDELPRLPACADLVVRARPEAAAATSQQLRADLRSGLDRVLSSSRAGAR
jgi:ribonuclease P protein component